MRDSDGRMGPPIGAAAPRSSPANGTESAKPTTAARAADPGVLNIAVVMDRDEQGSVLIRELQRLRHNVRHIWPMPHQIPLQFDAVFCAPWPDLPSRIPWVPGEPSSAVILVDNGRQEPDLTLVRNCAAHGVLYAPFTARSVEGTLQLAREHFLYERRLRTRIDKLDESLRTMRAVERAKVIVMGAKSVGEDEAYLIMRRQAMERRVTIGALANAIIDSQELLG